MIRLVLIIILFPINYTLANDYISKDPNHLSRGSFGKAYVTKLKNKNAYQIIKDPTGFSPIEEVEMFSPKKGDCSDSKHWGKRGGGVTDCNSGRQRIEVSQGSKDGVRKRSLKKKVIFILKLVIIGNILLAKNYLKFVIQNHLKIQTNLV